MDFGFLIMGIIGAVVTGGSRLVRATWNIELSRKSAVITLGVAFLINALLVKWAALSFNEGAFVLAMVGLWTLLGCWAVDRAMLSAAVSK